MEVVPLMDTEIVQRPMEVVPLMDTAIVQRAMEVVPLMDTAIVKRAMEVVQLMDTAIVQRAMEVVPLMDMAIVQRAMEVVPLMDTAIVQRAMEVVPLMDTAIVPKAMAAIPRAMAMAVVRPMDTRHMVPSMSSVPPIHMVLSTKTSTMMRTFLVQNLPNPIGPEPVTSGPMPSSKPTAYSPAALELMSFKKGIKREITAYPSLKDERYFDGFKRSLFIVAKSHECSEVLDPNYTLGSEPEEKELFEAKQTFMFSVFNTDLQTDMGKTIVRRHLVSTDAQAVWKELSEHMRTSSKGASEKRRLTQYVTNTGLDDNLKGTTEQLVLHFNEQFRQLEEISEDDERLPPTVNLTLLQTAVRSINDLRIVETLDEFQSTTHGHGSSTSLSYDTYYDLLINACVRYDKTKKANIGKRRNVCATNIDDTYIDSPTPCIDNVPDSPYGDIDLPPDEFYQVHALSSRHPPSQRPGQPSRPPFRPQSQHPMSTNPLEGMMVLSSCLVKSTSY